LSNISGTSIKGKDRASSIHAAPARPTSILKSNGDYVLQRHAFNIRIIVRLQAWVRGSRARRQAKFLKAKKAGANKYFTLDEL